MIGFMTMHAATESAKMPPETQMYDALVRRDASYEGIFIVGVRTTGILCRPTCPARKPAARNVEYFRDASAALLAGYRPCKRCRPMEPVGELPEWLRALVDSVEREPGRRFADADLRVMGLEPARVRRWFQRHHGMTFHAYQRARRLGRALGQLELGAEIPEAGFDNGFESLSGFHDAIHRLAGGSPGASRDAKVVRLTRVPTPLGPMIAGVTDEALCLLEFADRPMLETQLHGVRKRLGAVLVPGDNQITARIAGELDAYFAGSLRVFTVPLELAGTDFQRLVWAELQTIAYGETRSYGEQARRIARPRAVRAVARANGDNRLSIVIPCHRVIGADGKLTGYGGGLWRKQRLLELEQGAH